MMMGDGKSLAAMIVAKTRPSLDASQASNQKAFEAKAGEPGPSDESDDQGKLSACEEMIDAFKNGDAKGLMEALSSFISMSDEE